MITEATDEDAPAIDALCVAAFSPLRECYVPTGQPPDLPAPVVTFAYKEHEQVMGTISCYKDPPYLRLFRIAVTPDHQQHGIAARMVDHVAQTVAAPAKLDLALYIINETGNRHIFNKLGFSTKTTTRAAFASTPGGDTVHETEMERPVSS